jgi:hypothetical protein
MDPNRKQYSQEAKEATNYLLTVVVPTLAKYLKVINFIRAFLLNNSVGSARL